jgi:hypothetical protein
VTIAAGIMGVGLNCPLGQGLAAVGRSYREKERNFVKLAKGPVGLDGHPITLSCVISYTNIRNFELRLQRLFAGAVDALVESTPIKNPVALRLVVPAWLASNRLADLLRLWLQETYASCFSDVTFLVDGDTIALYEVARGLQDIQQGRAPALAVGALDSFMDAELLDLLAINGRLHGKTTPHGLIPGEAAALFLLAPSQQEGSGRLGTILSVFTGYERENLYSSKAVIGRGLAKPLRMAFDAYAPARFLADLNGERWRSEDIGFALSGARVPDDLLGDFETPLGQTGDCGAVNSLILAAISLGIDPRKEQAGDEAEFKAISIVSLAHWQGARCVAVIRSEQGIAA